MADSPYNKDGTLKNDPGRPEKPETGESDEELNEKVDRQEKLIRKLIAMQPNDRKDFVARFQ